MQKGKIAIVVTFGVIEFDSMNKRGGGGGGGTMGNVNFLKQTIYYPKKKNFPFGCFNDEMWTIKELIW